MMNGLGNQGAIALGNILPTNESLTELNVSNNRIEKDGASIFASKLESNRRLRKLWVGASSRSVLSADRCKENVQFGNNNIGTLGSLVLLKAIDHIKSQVEYLNIEVRTRDDNVSSKVQLVWHRMSSSTMTFITCTHKSISTWDHWKWFMVAFEDGWDLPTQVVRSLFWRRAKDRISRTLTVVPGFTIMDDIDLRHLDTKSLHAMFQRDPFKILGRMAKEGGYDFVKALKKWDLEEHGDLTYSLYVIDFPSAVKVGRAPVLQRRSSLVEDAGIVLDKTLHFILWNHLKKIGQKGSVSYL